MFKKNHFSKKSKTKKSDKLSLPELVWFGFNYTAGISFTAVFSTLLYSKVGANLGTHMIWIFLIEGLIAGTCAWSFARLSQIHPGSNGAAYIYTRSAYGRFWGWLVAFIQYSTLPVIITAQIVSMIRINFTNPDLEYLHANWGVWTNLGLDLIGILIYALISGVLFLGIKAFKIFVNISGYIKWITTFLLIIAIVTLFIMAKTTNYQNVVEQQQLTINSFSEAFTSCFFFFLGFETYATIGKNVKNPQKNISKSIVIVMILTTFFYVLITILMIGAISGYFTDNPNLQIFDILGKKMNAEWLGIFGVLVMLVCTISLKANSQMQNALYGGAILEPLANEGYIPFKYQDLNQDKIPYKAARLNLVIVLSFTFIWLVIPDLVQAITDSARKVSAPSSVLDFSTITGEVSLIMIIIYSCVITIALKLSWEKKIRHNKLEIIVWFFILLFLLWQLVMWFINLINGFISAINNINSPIAENNAKGVTKLVSSSIQIIYLVVMFVFALVWYFWYYYPKLKLRLIEKTQGKYDQDFLLQDDWPFVAKNLQIEIDNYLERNIKITGTEKNQNYQFAQKVRAELLASEGEWKEEN